MASERLDWARDHLAKAEGTDGDSDALAETRRAVETAIDEIGVVEDRLEAVEATLRNLPSFT